MRVVAATVFCDASFTRTQSSVVAAWAAWVRVDFVHNPIRGYGLIKEDARVKHSTEAEICAALNGIWLAAQHGANDILVRSDCITVEQLIQGKAKARRLIKLWERTLALPGYQGIKLRAKHVKGHTQATCVPSWVNTWCDKHASNARRAALRGEQCQTKIW